MFDVLCNQTLVASSLTDLQHKLLAANRARVLVVQPLFDALLVEEMAARGIVGLQDVSTLRKVFPTALTALGVIRLSLDRWRFVF